MILRSAILWMHVLSGVLWVGLCATFVLAAAISSGRFSDSSAFDISVVAQINRVCVLLALAIPLTGVANLFFVFRQYGHLSAQFVAIVLAKIGLLGLMSLALGISLRAVRRLRPASSNRAANSPQVANLRPIVAAYGVIVGAGIVALGLGLWLSGS